MKSTIRLGKIAGIEVGLHYSWFPVLALFSWYLARIILPQRQLYSQWASATYWAIGLAVALLLFGSVLIHELAHSLVARARGYPVQGITLFLLGGVSNLGLESRRARDEFLISAAGPLASLLLFGVLWALFHAVPDETTPLAAVVWYLWFSNLALALFNLLPAFPMDGGRVLRSVVWAATGSSSKATWVASRAGQLLGFVWLGLGGLLIFWGIWEGFWIVLIGWFLQSSATASLRQMKESAGISSIRVGEVMDWKPDIIGPETSLADAIRGRALKEDGGALLVCVSGRLKGVLTHVDVEGVPQERWHDVMVGEAMTRVPLWYVTPEDEIYRALGLLAEHSINQAPVLDGDRLVGLLTKTDIIRYLHSDRERRAEPPPDTLD